MAASHDELQETNDFILCMQWIRVCVNVFDKHKVNVCLKINSSGNCQF